MVEDQRKTTCHITMNNSTYYAEKKSNCNMVEIRKFLELGKILVNQLFNENINAEIGKIRWKYDYYHCWNVQLISYDYRANIKAGTSIAIDWIGAGQLNVTLGSHTMTSQMAIIPTIP